MASKRIIREAWNRLKEKKNPFVGAWKELCDQRESERMIPPRDLNPPSTSDQSKRPVLGGEGTKKPS